MQRWNQAAGLRVSAAAESPNVNSTTSDQTAWTRRRVDRANKEILTKSIKILSEANVPATDAVSVRQRDCEADDGENGIRNKPPEAWWNILFAVVLPTYITPRYLDSQDPQD